MRISVTFYIGHVIFRSFEMPDFEFYSSEHRNHRKNWQARGPEFDPRQGKTLLPLSDGHNMSSEHHKSWQTVVSTCSDNFFTCLKISSFKPLLKAARWTVWVESVPWATVVTLSKNYTISDLRKPLSGFLHSIWARNTSFSVDECTWERS